MQMQLYSVYDVLAKIYATPFVSLNHAMAHRSFGNLVQDPQSNVSRNPADYYLYHVATFDDATGEMVNVTNNELICKAIDFIADYRTVTAQKE